jgi:hypothetical protein
MSIRWDGCPPRDRGFDPVAVMASAGRSYPRYARDPDDGSEASWP